MKELKELREILCTVPEIKENISEKWGTVKVTDTYELLKEETPIQERHIRMYCERINIYIVITSTGMISMIEKGGLLNNTGIQLDNSKDLEQQSPETLQAIINFLKGV